MRTKSHLPLTAQADPRSVASVAELSTLTADDRRILALPNTRLARARIAPLLILALPQVQKMDGALPSYVSTKVQELIDAFARWERDEREVNDHAGS